MSGNWFGDQNLGVKYAVVLGALIAVVTTYAFIRLYIQKRRTKKISATLKAKEADIDVERLEQEALTKQGDEEGDLFGIRALEHGFTAGLPQSRPTTPKLQSASVSTLTVNRIPYGKTPARSITASTAASMQSTLAIELDNAVGSPSNSPPKSTDNLGSSSKSLRNEVDMSVAVPASPRAGPLNARHSPGSSSSSTIPNHASKPSEGSVESFDFGDFTAKKEPFWKTEDPSGSGSERPSQEIQTPPAAARPTTPGLTFQKFLTPQQGRYIPTGSSHSAQSSVSSLDQTSQDQIGLAYPTESPPKNGKGKTRASSNSLGDFYDSYYDSRLSSNVQTRPQMRQNPEVVPEVMPEPVNERRFSKMPSRVLL
ncbi:hypothetical protein BZA77DRAFT_146470 [Pyronema omphalodes]|nr:hypothetical protein BZA77DRAFT_146470 [Pyronema omphalodes]